jgi:hypothetical protein
MMKRTKAAILGLATIFGVCALGGCKSESAVSWQGNGIPRHEHPTQGWGNYHFVYHPDAQVYFEPYTQTWYWFEKGDWCAGDQAPPWVKLVPERAQVVKLPDTLPFRHHMSVKSMHPSFYELPTNFDQKKYVMWQQEQMRERKMRIAATTDMDPALDF